MKKIIITIIVLLILAGLVFAGWYLWHTNEQILRMRLSKSFASALNDELCVQGQSKGFYSREECSKITKCVGKVHASFIGTPVGGAKTVSKALGQLKEGRTVNHVARVFISSSDYGHSRLAHQCYFNTIYPREISGYTLYGGWSPHGAEIRCEQPEEVSGEVCQRSLELIFADAYNNAVLVGIGEITKGKTEFDNFLSSLIKNNQFGEISFGNRKIYHGPEDHELLWQSGNVTIFNQEFTIEKHTDGTDRYNYHTATGQNPVTKWFLENYPPID